MSNNSVALLYKSHLATLNDRVKEALTREDLDGLIIHSGQLNYQFLDDNAYSFKVNPHFKAWLPLLDNPNCWLVIDGCKRPKLIFYLPVDFWHKVADKPTEDWANHFDIEFLKQAEKVEKFLPYDREKYAYIGEYIEVAKALGIKHINPDKVLHFLHYHRAYKTEYEHFCLREANKIAIRAHKAAADAFIAKASEFEIHQAYVSATNTNQEILPYNNIVALNQNAAILHYMVQQNTPPEKHLSFLIDAGASFNGYAADITRTYASSQGLFAELIEQVDSLTRRLAKALKPGLPYIEVHEQAHVGIAQILYEARLVNLLPENIVQQGITKTFFPHGIGHYLGLQVHDVGAHMADDQGTPNKVLEAHPYLRCTREIEPNQVFTIEPGIYFIESLLAKLQVSEASKYINWDMVNRLRPYGGVRIEDDIIVHSSHNENMTRELWSKTH